MSRKAGQRFSEGANAPAQPIDGAPTDLVGTPSSATDRKSLPKRAAARSTHPLRPSPSVRRFPIEGGLLLLDGAANCLYAYNDTARHVWELIAAGRGEPDLIAEFADHWGIPQTVARTDTEAMVAEWRSQNVLVERGARRRAPAKSPRRRQVAWNKPPAGGRWAEWICTVRGIPIS